MIGLGSSEGAGKLGSEGDTGNKLTFCTFCMHIGINGKYSHREGKRGDVDLQSYYSNASFKKSFSFLHSSIQSGVKANTDDVLCIFYDGREAGELICIDGVIVESFQDKARQSSGLNEESVITLYHKVSLFS